MVYIKKIRIVADEIFEICALSRVAGNARGSACPIYMI